MLIGRKLNVPSITYVHEYIFGDKDLMPHGCRDRFYLDLIDSLSRHLLCASEYVKSAFLNQDKRSVLYPFAPYLGLTEFQDSEENLAQFSLVVVGTKSRRKNTHFAITVLKALRLRGKNLCLYIIGSDNSGSFKLTQQHLVRGEKNVFILPHMSDPFKIPGKKINLVCTYNEGFGLTITESLARGIPIVASEPGGPNEILPAEFVYAVDDVDQCVRAIEKIMANYEEHSLRVKEQYQKVLEKNSHESRVAKVSKAIELAVHSFNNGSKKEIPLDLECFKKIINPIISTNQIFKNVSDASSDSPQPFSVMQICDLVMKEMKSPGSAVLMDINNFDVVPFGRSKNMDHLLQAGISPLIELLANIKNPAKQNMMAYIVLRLQELRLSIPSPKILCLGDPLGIDSIILASCGFNVHHISFEQALMGKCAEFNFKMAMQYSDDELMLSTLKIPDAPYDAIVSLEHIQKSPDPQKFLKNISNNLSTGGLLFISESFDGIDDQRPANLYLNEKFASTLPILAAPFFKLEDVNTQPLGKPYLFSKSLNNLIGEDSYSFF